MTVGPTRQVLMISVFLRPFFFIKIYCLIDFTIYILNLTKQITLLTYEFVTIIFTFSLFSFSLLTLNNFETTQLPIFTAI